MNKEQGVERETAGPPTPGKGPLLLVGAIVLAAIVGGLMSRSLVPAQPSTSPPSRPIVQLVRQQPGLPDLSDLVDRLCPSVAMIRSGDASSRQKPAGGGNAPAFAVSTDGWLLTSAPPARGVNEVVFGDGRSASISDVRTDPVSGLTIMKADGVTLQPLIFNDQPFPRVGQFGLGLAVPAGNGCSASAAMIASDFLADGRGLTGYVRVQAISSGWAAGSPFVGSDGRVIGVASDSNGTIVPGPLAAAIVDELIRNSPSPSSSFGFRLIDFTPPMSTRLGDTRSGAGIAVVQANSAAAQSGLEAGDIVIAVNDEPVSSASEVNRAVDAIDTSGTMTVVRGTQQLPVKIARS